MNWYDFDENGSIDENRDRRLLTMPVLSSGEMEVVKQCMHPVWDGNVVSKTARNSLFQKGLIVRYNGWQIVSMAGLALLKELNMLDDRDIWIKGRR